MPDYKHIILNGRSTSFPYSTYGGGQSLKREIDDRFSHGNRIKDSFKNAVNEFSEGDLDYSFVYIEFESALNFELDIDKFDNNKGDIKLASFKKIVLNIDDDGSENVIYRASVCLNKNAVGQFLKKIEKYISGNNRFGRPHYEKLIANIEEVKCGTLKSFWQEPEALFPSEGQDVWWEVWLSREDNATELSESFNNLMREALVQVSEKTLVFPEHIVTLIKGTPRQLRNSILLYENIAEIRKPVETADFFTSLDKNWEGNFIDDLNARLVRATESNISVCLLDTGLTLTNPLLEKLIPETNLDAIDSEWTLSDTVPSGHGTLMAGLILFGDLTDALASTENVQVFSHLESIKIIEKNKPNDPDLYGQITLEAIYRGEILNPNNKRVVCMAVTGSGSLQNGRPSSWSSAVDQISFGELDKRNEKVLILVSSGNLPLHARLNSPLSNDDFPIEDPAQAFNILTVGAYTLKDAINLTDYPGAELLATRGGMAPCNTTSVSWDKEWPRKPDIVLEGGNDGIYQGGVCYPDSLKLLSTGKGGFNKSWLTTFGDTSASTALASKIVAELYYEYSELWPETIRGLIVHSANWTSSMLNHKSIQDLSLDEKKRLISQVGYGVPNLYKAKHSANNSLTLIAQKLLRPYKYDESRVKTNEFHLFDLPWPADILTQLAETQVVLTVTLSYFIEPNPGNKSYKSATNYRSHGLRFKMIDRNEREQVFKARVSRSIREEQDDYVAEGYEDWILGSQIRDKGSIHKDIWIGNAADLALRNKIAVYPIGGWWKGRKKLKRYDSDARYSLIVTIESENETVDIYTPVLTQINVDIEV